MSEDREKILAEQISRAVNLLGFDNEKFAEYVCRDHRTLQQSAFRAFAACILKWEQMLENDRFDLRNEATVKTCSLMAREVRDTVYDLKSVPFV